MAMVLGCMQGVPVSHFRVMRGFFVVARLMMLGSLAVVLGRMLVMLRRFLVVFVNIVLTVHLFLPVHASR
jgi:hypothetical protein